MDKKLKKKNYYSAIFLVKSYDEITESQTTVSHQHQKCRQATISIMLAFFFFFSVWVH